MNHPSNKKKKEINRISLQLRRTVLQNKDDEVDMNIMKNLLKRIDDFFEHFDEKCKQLEQENKEPQKK